MKTGTDANLQGYVKWAALEIEKVGRLERAYEAILAGVALGGLMASPIPFPLRIGLLASFLLLFRRLNIVAGLGAKSFARLLDSTTFCASYLAERINAMITSPETASSLAQTSFGPGYNEYINRLVTSGSKFEERRRDRLSADFSLLLCALVGWAVFAFLGWIFGSSLR
jgi:hypothetical protein